MNSEKKLNEIKYLTKIKNRKFVNNINSKLMKLCKKEKTLENIIQLLDKCKNDKKCNNLIRDYLNAKTNYLSGQQYKLMLKLYGNQFRYIYIEKNPLKKDLRKAIERDMSLNLISKLKNKCPNKFNWKKVWQKNDIEIDQINRIKFDSKEINETLELSKNSILKFVTK